MTDLAWQKHAACRDTDTLIFFDAAHTSEALAICQPCPVKRQCHKLGKGVEGVWGGKAYYPRQQYRFRK